MQIPQQTLDGVLDYYREECRFLKEAKLEYPEATARFQIPSPFYLREGIDTGHLNAIDLIICYNQLTLSLLAEISRRKLDTELPKFTIPELSTLLIVSMSNVKFNEPIDPKEFQGKIRLNQVIPKKNNTLYFFKTSYDFGDGKATGEIDSALVLQ